MFWDLFLSFFQIGLFSFGGGYAALPLIQAQVVEKHAWLSLAEFSDLITISQMTPGPIAINAASFVGLRVSGLGGALVATFACVLPSTLIVLSLAYLYGKYKELPAMKSVLYGLRPAILSLIGKAGLAILLMAIGVNASNLEGSHIDIFALLLFALAFFLYRRYRKINPILIMLGLGISGGLVYAFLLPA